MPFPPFGTTVPTLQPYQFSFDGYTFGPGTALEIQKIEGADLPVVRTGDAGRPRDAGRFIGLDVLDGRDLTITAELGPDGPGFDFPTAWQALAAVTVPGGVTETPLFFNLPGYGTLATMTRVRKRATPIDIQFSYGQLASVMLMFSSSDPRWYAPTLRPSASPPSTVGGFVFPLVFPLVFGGGGFAGSISVTNSGNIDTRPLLTITGPCVNPSITLAAGSNPNLTFALTMNAGDTLVIDTDFHTATYYTAGSPIGTSRLYTLVLGSQWFVLQPGVSTIQFLTGDGLGQIAVEYAPAYLV